MQLFLVAPLLVYPLWRWPRGGALFLAALAAWSTALRYSVVVDNELSTIVYFGVSYVSQRQVLAVHVPPPGLTCFPRVGQAVTNVPDGHPVVHPAHSPAHGLHHGRRAGLRPAPRARVVPLLQGTAPSQEPVELILESPSQQLFFFPL